MSLLEPTERSYVEEQLFAELGLRADLPKAWFLDRVTNTQYRLALETRNASRDQIKHALNLALMQQGRRYPGALLDILNDLAALDVGMGVIRDKVQAKLAALAAVPAGHPGNCLSDQLLEGNFPFINRGLLRAKLEQLFGAVGTPLFVVNGETGSGKSYTLRLLQHCSVRTGNFVLVPILPPLLPEAGSEMWPEDLAEEIVITMDLPPDRQSKPVRDGLVSINQYGRRLTNWLLSHIKSDDQNRYWIMLDGFGFDELNEWTRSFLSTLAGKLIAGVYRQKVKLILLNYPTRLLSAQEGDYDEEIIKMVTRDDVKHYMRWWLGSRNEPFTEQDLTTMIDSWLSGSSNNDSEPLSPKQLKDANTALRSMV